MVAAAAGLLHKKRGKGMLRYSSLHKRLGKASEHLCVGCGQQASEWAFDNKEPYLLRTNNGRLSKYYPDVSRYSPMCRKCHGAFDASQYCKRGHLRSEFTRHKPKGHPDCIKCEQEMGRLRRLRKKMQRQAQDTEA